MNNFFGAFYVTMSRYDAAMAMFEPVPGRCPGGRVAETAAFRLAHCLEQAGRRAEAVRAYEAFIEDYPGSSRVQIATRAIQTLGRG